MTLTVAQDPLASNGKVRGADLKQVKTIFAAHIIALLEERGVAVRKAGALTCFAEAGFSRDRNADLGGSPVRAEPADEDTRGSRQRPPDHRACRIKGR